MHKQNIFLTKKPKTMSSKIDLTLYQELNYTPIHKTVINVTVRLDRKTILNILLSDCIVLFNGQTYEADEYFLLHLLINKDFGETKLELKKLTL